MSTATLASTGRAKPSEFIAKPPKRRWFYYELGVVVYCVNWRREFIFETIERHSKDLKRQAELQARFCAKWPEHDPNGDK